MRILKVWFSEYPWDVRVEKVSDALIEAGHSVDLLCRNNKGGCRKERGEMTIHRLPFVGNGDNALTKLLNLPAFFNVIWFWEIFRICKSRKIQLILVRDLPLTIPCLVVGKWFGVPVIFDMAECHPEIFKNYFRWNAKSLLKENPWIARIVESITVKHVDHVFVMCDESRERLARLGANRERISVISNTTRIEPHQAPDVESDGIRLIYHGMIGEYRGLDTVVDSIRITEERYHVKVYFDVLGSVGDHIQSLKEKVEKAGLKDRVTFHGWVDNAELASYIDRAHVGVLPLWKMSHYDVTVSNKLFDYMACGRPVICSDTTAMARIVMETNSGLVFRDRDVDSFAECVLRLNDPRVRQEFGANGMLAIQREYNWGMEKQKIQGLLNWFGGRGGLASAKFSANDN